MAVVPPDRSEGDSGHVADHILINDAIEEFETETTALAASVAAINAELGSDPSGADPNVAARLSGFTAAIAAINAELGTNPSGTFSTVVDRLDDTQTRLAALEAGEPPPPPDPPPTPGDPQVLVSLSQLNLAKTKVLANENPWKSTYTVLTGNSRTGSTYHISWDTQIPATVSNEATHAAEFLNQAHAAYGAALRWFIDGSTAHRDVTITRLNEWANRCTLFQDYFTDKGAGNRQGVLWASWGVTHFVRAAEIIRCTSTAWDPLEQVVFSQWLSDVFMRGPIGAPGSGTYALLEHSENANWQAVTSAARMEIAAFQRDTAAMVAAANFARPRVPQSIYLKSDGIRPVPYWSSGTGTTPDYIAAKWSWTTDAAAQAAGGYLDGHVAELGSDMGHTANTLGGWMNACETAYHLTQAGVPGLDLYTEFSERNRAGLELSAGYYNEVIDAVQITGTAASVDLLGQSTWTPTGNQDKYGTPTWPFNSSNSRTRTGAAGDGFDDGGASSDFGWEVGYNHYVVREGYYMPQLDRLVKRLRTTAGGWSAGPQNTALHMAWESLTHAAVAPPAYLADDKFQRTVAAGAWGSATTGGAWTVTGTGATPETSYSVNNARGAISMPQGLTREATLASVSATNVDIYTDFRITADMVAEGRVITRARVIGTTEYRLRVACSSTVINCRIDRVESGVGTTLVSSVSVQPSAYLANTIVKTRFRVTGTGTTTLQGKCWIGTVPEPTAWLVSTTDTTAALQNPGAVGLHFQTQSTAGTRVLEINDFVVRPA